MAEFTIADTNEQATGYLALPKNGTGPGILVLHAWWGLNDFFKHVCDRLAEAGFVAFAPDLYAGKLTATIEEAQQLSAETEQQFDRVKATVLGANAYLQSHPALDTHNVGVIGFSMGAFWGAYLSTLAPEQIAAVVLFYGTVGVDFSQAKAVYQAHFAQNDPWEPQEGIQEMVDAMRAAGREVDLYLYPGAGHWFVEENRPDAYQAEAAQLAWERTFTFLRTTLGA